MLLLTVELWLISAGLFTVVLGINDQKRLLLNDPDVIQNRLNQMESKLQDIMVELNEGKQKVEQLTTQLNHQSTLISDGKSTYIRWGSHSCNTNATLIYSGQLGGTSYASTGGAANPLCMVHDVIWGSHQSEGNMAEIHGAEYQDHFWGPNTGDKDVPCAVCKPNTHSSVLMIPGRNQCLPGWTEEYHGYLSANLVSHPHTQHYICVDEKVEFLDGGTESKNGYLLYGVRAQCGSLKCPPYIRN
ncbi:uncharacterized protein LOC134711148 [Mytilus trossulus]|uniref:uncharacterized protein LOC134711148 n=1 Tax=Mytilus trossulus TaxID=6551 RepID=UPI003005D14D